MTYISNTVTSQFPEINGGIRLQRVIIVYMYVNGSTPEGYQMLAIVVAAMDWC